MTDPNDARFVGEWLASETGRAMLDRLAPAILRKARSRRLSLRFLDLDLGWRDVGPGQDLEDDIRSELACFLLEKATMIRGLLSSEENNPAAYLEMAFQNHWIDQTRKREVDVHRYMRKRILDVLQDSPGFLVSTEKGRPTRFSRDPDGRPLPPLLSEDLDEIAFPPDWAGGRDLDSLNTNKAIPALADHFYRAVSNLWGGVAVQIELSDFIRWFFRHADMGEPTAAEGSPEMVPAPRPSANPPPFDEQTLDGWAECCARRLTDPEKTAVYDRYWRRATLGEIAEKLGYKSPASASNQLAAAEKKMKTFLRDLPGLSPEDLEEAVFSAFLDAFKKYLERSIPTP